MGGVRAGWRRTGNSARNAHAAAAHLYRLIVIFNILIGRYFMNLHKCECR